MKQTVLAIIIALALVACGGGGDEEEEIKQIPDPPDCRNQPEICI
jgi:hypothetical protein